MRSIGRNQGLLADTSECRLFSQCRLDWGDGLFVPEPRTRQSKRTREQFHFPNLSLRTTTRPANRAPLRSAIGQIAARCACSSYINSHRAWPATARFHYSLSQFVLHERDKRFAAQWRAIPYRSHLNREQMACSSKLPVMTAALGVPHHANGGVGKRRIVQRR